MAEIFRSKEVYKKLPYEYDNKHEMVPVRGVYVSGEYRPPYYNEPTLRIAYINGVDCTVDDFRTEELDVQSDNTVGMYKIDVTNMIWDIQRYEKDYINASPTDTVGMYKIDVDIATFHIIKCPIAYKNSTPEHTLRLMSVSSDPCVVTNVNP